MKPPVPRRNRRWRYFEAVRDRTIRRRLERLNAAARLERLQNPVLQAHYVAMTGRVD